MKAFKWIVVAALLISSCTGKVDVPKLPDSEAEAAEMCYIAALKEATSEAGSSNLTDTQFLHAQHFAMLSVVARQAPKVPTLEDYSTYEPVYEKYKSMDLKKRIPDCSARFPQTQKNIIVDLPPNEPERAALCFYSSKWVLPLLEGMGVNKSETTQQANNIISTFESNNQLMTRMVEHYGMKTPSDGDRLRLDTLAKSAHIGSFDSIIQACVKSSWN